jgi:hypothetical protein
MKTWQLNGNSTILVEYSLPKPRDHVPCLTVFCNHCHHIHNCWLSHLCLRMFSWFLFSTIVFMIFIFFLLNAYYHIWHFLILISIYVLRIFFLLLSTLIRMFNESWSRLAQFYYKVRNMRFVTKIKLFCKFFFIKYFSG